MLNRSLKQLIYRSLDVLKSICDDVFGQLEVENLELCVVEHNSLEVNGLNSFALDEMDNNTLKILNYHSLIFTEISFHKTY